MDLYRQAAGTSGATSGGNGIWIVLALCVVVIIVGALTQYLRGRK